MLFARVGLGIVFFFLSVSCSLGQDQSFLPGVKSRLFMIAQKMQDVVGSNFLREAVVSGVAKLTKALPEQTHNQTDKKKDRIAIIGAGLSGLTMGYRLKQMGYENVSIFEARPRVGGRVHTVYVKNSDGGYSLAELGGQNITDGGDSRNFRKVAGEVGVEVEDDPRCLTRGFFAEGILHDSRALTRSFFSSGENVHWALERLPLSSLNTMREVIDFLFHKNDILRRIFAYHVGSYEGLPVEELPGSANMETLKYFLPGGVAEFQQASVGETLCETFVFKYIRGGNAQFPLALARALSSSVFLNKPLKRVSRHEDGSLKLDFADMSHFFCDKLILSNPCGTYSDVTWSGVIPNERLSKIGTVQYGRNGKVFVPYKQEKEPPYSSVTTDHVGTLQNNDYRLLMLYTDGVWGRSLSGNLHEYYSSMIDMVESNYGKQSQLRRVFPVVPSDRNYERYDCPIVKSWTEDRYAYGSYSASGTKLGEEFLAQCTVNGIPVKKMFAPVGDKIYFIGEHTSLSDAPGTMEAAVESAERVSGFFR